MYIKLIKALRKTTKSNSIRKNVTYNANLNVLDNEIELEMNGIVSTMLIQFQGAVYFQKLLPTTTRVKYSKNTLLITNLFRNRFDKTIFNYYGDLKITHCRIINFNGESVIPTINNRQQESIIDSSSTGFEDDTLILYDDNQKDIQTKSSRGVSGNYVTQEGFEKISNKAQTRKRANEAKRVLKRSISNLYNKIAENANLTAPKSEVARPTGTTIKAPPKKPARAETSGSGVRISERRKEGY